MVTCMHACLHNHCVFLQALQDDVVAKLEAILGQEGTLPRFASGNQDQPLDLATASKRVSFT